MFLKVTLPIQNRRTLKIWRKALPECCSDMDQTIPFLYTNFLSGVELLLKKKNHLLTHDWLLHAIIYFPEFLCCVITLHKGKVTFLFHLPSALKLMEYICFILSNNHSSRAESSQVLPWEGETWENIYNHSLPSYESRQEFISSKNSVWPYYYFNGKLKLTYISVAVIQTICKNISFVSIW